MLDGALSHLIAMAAPRASQANEYMPTDAMRTRMNRHNKLMKAWEMNAYE